MRIYFLKKKTSIHIKEDIPFYITILNKDFLQSTFQKYVMIISFVS